MTEAPTRAWSADVRDLGDRIAGLTLQEARQLSAYLREVHAIAPSAVPRRPGPEPIVDPDPRPAERRVRLDGFDPARKLMLIKLLRELLGLGLREAKELAESAPREILGPLPPLEAARLQQQLEDVGARTTLVA